MKTITSPQFMQWIPRVLYRSDMNLSLGSNQTRHAMLTLSRNVTFILFTLILAGCAKSIEHHSVPADLTQNVKPASNENLRIWGDVSDDRHMARASRRFAMSNSESSEVNLLALSGAVRMGLLVLAFFLLGVSRGSVPNLIW